jgi:hypothetical protein
MYTSCDDPPSSFKHTAQHSTKYGVHHSTSEHCTAQYITAHQSTAQYITAQQSAAHHNPANHAVYDQVAAIHSRKE